MSQLLLIRYGVVPEVSRFAHELADLPGRHERVVIATHRGLQLGTVLEVLRPKPAGAHSENAADPDPPVTATDPAEPRVLRRATPEDEVRHTDLQLEAQRMFADWQTRIRDWKLDFELIDLEWTLDRQKLILYVLGAAGPDITRLALLAAGVGPTVVEVQPVNAQGPVAMLSGAEHGCGTGGCGCHDNH